MTPAGPAAPPAPPAPPAAGWRILAVEDDPDDLLLLTEALSGEPDFVLEHRTKLSDALDRLGEESFDVVFLDLHLPDSTGIAAVGSVREVAPRVPIIVLTREVSTDVELAAVQAGAQDYLPKNKLDGDTVLRSVRHAIERHRLRRALEQTADGLARSQSNLQSMLTTSADAIIVLDEAGVVLFANAAAETLFNRSAAHLEGEMFDILLSAGDATDLELDGGKTANVRVVETQWSGAPALMATFRDITARVRVQAALEASRQRLEALVDRLPEGVALLGADDRIVMANAQGETILRSIAGVGIGDVLVSLGELQLPLIRARTRDIGRVELILEGPPELALHALARPLDINRPQAGTLLVVRDVTRELDIQRQAHNQDRLALIGQLAAGAAHDFNNHLQVINGHAELLSARSESLGGSERKHVAAILHQGRQASRIARQILDFGPGGAGKSSQKRILDVAGVITEAWRVLARLIPANIQVAIDVASGGEYPVQADPTQIHQIITNLAINARDAMPDGGALRLSLERLDLAADASPPAPALSGGPWAVLSVVDTGTGVPEGVRDRIFEPFVTTKDPAEGTGLGLSQVYGLVREHGGGVDLHSEVGVGATFRVFLPIADPAGDSQSTIPSSRSVPLVPVAREDTQDVLEETLPPAGGSLVLVVEDDADVREVLATLLDHLGYAHVLANDGRHALEVYEANAERIGVVLTDLSMPEMSGAQLLEVLHERAPQLEVFLLTAHDLALEYDRYAELGASGWIQKPVDLDQLARILATSLARARRRR